MQNHKRVILCGPTCAGKNFIRDKFKDKGYQIDVSYTSRYPRKNEKNGSDYNFISKHEFEKMIKELQFYEWVKYGDNYYGTGLKEWKWCDIFIMETDGISKILLEDRPSCLIIYVNTPIDIRIDRMYERKWDEIKIKERLKVDSEKFNNFKDFDIEISSYENGYRDK
jgi:guanylate kinase